MTEVIDTNIIVRFFTKDDPTLFSQAKKIFETAQSRKSKIYLDEVVLAETIWVLLSNYKYTKLDICPKLIKLLTRDWIISPRKKTLIKTLTIYSQRNFSFVDCWAYCLAQDEKLPLSTFDQKLKKFVL